MKNFQSTKIQLEKVLEYSPFSYKDPYNPKGGLIYYINHKLQNNKDAKIIEKQFVDFKPFYLDTQFREIYHDLYHAYRRGDKVVLARSLSDPMYEYTKHLLAQNKPNPFFKTISRVHLIQPRINDDQKDDPLAQLTFRFHLKDSEGQRFEQYNVFERRFIDKMSYLEWKLLYSLDYEDLLKIHQNKEQLMHQV